MSIRSTSQGTVQTGPSAAMTAVLMLLDEQKAEIVCPYDGQVLGEYAGAGSVIVRICRRCKTYWAFDSRTEVYFNLPRNDPDYGKLRAGVDDNGTGTGHG